MPHIPHLSLIICASLNQLCLRMLFPHSSVPHIWTMEVCASYSDNNCIAYPLNLCIRQPTKFSEPALMFFFFICHSLADNLCLPKSVVPRNAVPTFRCPAPCSMVYIFHFHGLKNLNSEMENGSVRPPQGWTKTTLSVVI